MSLRWKIALAMAAIATVVAAVFGTASYRTTRDRLLNEVDESLLVIERAIDGRVIGRNSFPDRGPLAGFDAQIIGPDGSVRESTFEVAIPVSDADRALIGQPRSSRFATVSTDAGQYRIRTIGLEQAAVQVGRSLDETNRILASLRTRTILLATVVAGVAAAVGLWIAGRVTASLRRLTEAAEHVGATGRLDVSVGDGGHDEVGRLSAAFDGMLAALASSKDEQQRLVQDAGHELRTPLTSLRTNVDVLRRFPEMPLDARREIVDDLHTETEELTALVDEVVSVASGGIDDEPVSSFDLVAAVREVAERFARRTDRPIPVRSDRHATMMSGRRAAIQRAVSCLLDNAAKFDRTGGPIEVDVSGVTVTVSDRGIGIAPGDVDRVFDRFHRSAEARTMPGSGLGLSIVREIARSHGGEAFAGLRDGGGAVVGFRLDGAPRS
ncbi:MAG: HAMP domain-containing histidine kinase [Ilumatobacter sp.]|nr:HAMP domain-containing histidine kinase [Ilumatobacter sp.]